MTAIIVRFNNSKENNKSDSVEVTSVTRKRALSPNPSIEGADCSTEENTVEDKRAKVENC